jgi:hypothetical protein
MFTQTWKKYLPVIFILIKRSTQGEQVLKMNHTDFERAAGGRKTKFSFSNLELTKARINSHVKHSPMAKEFAVLLQEDPAVRRYILDQHLEFSMTNDFTLTIKNHLLAIEPVADENADEVVAEETAVAHAD